MTIDFKNKIYLGVASPVEDGDMSNYYTKAQTRALVDAKQDVITGAATTITDNNLTANRALTSNSNGKVDVATTTTTELNYVHGVTSAIQTQLNNKASTALDNLSSDGQMIIDSANGTISNCILEIPQNIKLTLENNVLTLKAGSTVVDGLAVYTTVTTTEDKNYTISSGLSGRYLVFVRVSDVAFILMKNDRCVSGATDSLAELAENHIWLDTTAKEVNMVFSAGGKAIRSYPLCVIDVKNGVASFAKDSNGNDMIFNGAGFIGHHVFRLPNVSGCTGEGFTSGGKLNSNYYKPQNLLIQEMPSGNPTYGKRCLGFQAGTKMNYLEVDTVTESPAHQHIAWVYTYVREQNQTWVWTGNILAKQHEVPLVYYGYNGTTVTDFIICQPYDGARCLLTDEIKEEVATKQADVTTLTGYDATKTQTLKNVSGVLTWVDDE